MLLKTVFLNLEKISLESKSSQTQNAFHTHWLQWRRGFQQLAGSGFHSSSSSSNFMTAVFLRVSIWTCTCLQCMTLVIHLKSTLDREI